MTRTGALYLLPSQTAAFNHPATRANILEPFNIKTITRRIVALVDAKESEKAKKLLNIAYRVVEKEIAASTDEEKEDLLDYDDEKACELLFREEKKNVYPDPVVSTDIRINNQSHMETPFPAQYFRAIE